MATFTPNNSTKPRQMPWRTRWILVVWCAAVTLALFGNGNLWPIAGKLLETLICVGAIVLVASYAPIRAQFHRLPRSSRLFVGVLFSLLIVGQISGLRWATYPISNWSMYSRPQTTSAFKYLRMEARLSDGSLIELRPTELVPSLDHDRFRTKLIQLAQTAMNDPQAGVGESELHKTLAGLVRIYNHRNTTNPIRSTSIYLYETDIATYRANQPVTRQLVAQVKPKGE